MREVDRQESATEDLRKPVFMPPQRLRPKKAEPEYIPMLPLGPRRLPRIIRRLPRRFSPIPDTTRDRPPLKPAA